MGAVPRRRFAQHVSPDPRPRAVPGSRPYQLSFQYDFGFHFCGAIAYKGNYAITAAHCCEGQSASSLRMIACEHHLFEEDGQAVANVLSLTVHENYGPFGYEN